MFGLAINVSCVTYWGARAVFQNECFDILPDRQTFTGEENEDFTKWLNGRALPWLRTKVKEIHLTTDDRQVLTLSEFKYELKASPNASYGYLYIGAVEHKQEPGEPLRNRATGEDEPVVVINGVRFVVDKGMVPVGTKGIVKVNKIGPAKVVGYFNENYVDNHKLACLLVDIENPPNWLLRQTMEDDAEVLVKGGFLPRNKYTGGNFPDKESKAYRDWKKTWRMRPIPLWSNDFQPES